MGKRRFLPRSAARKSKFGCDNAGLPRFEKTPQGEIYLEMTPIPKDIQELAEAMFRESGKNPEAEVSSK